MALCLLNPLFVKPVVRTVRVAVKPKPAPVYAASCQCLLYKRAGLQGNLIKQHTGKGASLNQSEGAFVLAAKHLEDVLLFALGHNHCFVRPAPADAILFPHQLDSQVRFDDVFDCRFHRFSADGKPLAVISAHGIVHKSNRHKRRLAGTHRAVCNQRIVGSKRKGKNLSLLFTDWHFLPSFPPLLSALLSAGPLPSALPCLCSW